MATEDFTLEDLNFIKESLKYTKERFENYQDYPSYEYKQKRLKAVNDVAAKVSATIKSKSGK